MTQLIFGKRQQIQFNSAEDFYESLGFLSKNDGTTSIHWEHNETCGAWGSEGRIHCYKNTDSFPVYFRSAFTAGNGSIPYRINCNEFVRLIMEKHGFEYGASQNQTKIIATIPANHLEDFYRGLNGI